MSISRSSYPSHGILFFLASYLLQTMRIAWSPGDLHWNEIQTLEHLFIARLFLCSSLDNLPLEWYIPISIWRKILSSDFNLTLRLFSRPRGAFVFFKSAKRFRKVTVSALDSQMHRSINKTYVAKLVDIKVVIARWNAYLSMDTFIALLT